MDIVIFFGFIATALFLTFLYIYSNSMYGAMYGAVAGIFLMAFGLAFVIWPLEITYCDTVTTAQNGTGANISYTSDGLCETNSIDMPSIFPLLGWVLVMLGAGNIVVLVRNIRQTRESDTQES